MGDDCKKKGAGFSSFTADLFGSKDQSPPQSSSTAGVFASIFPPPSTVLGKKPSGAEVIGSWSNPNSAHQYHASSKQGTPAVQSDPASCNMPSDEKNPIFQDRAEPCNLSSSLYYGGQDSYTQSAPSTEVAATHPTFRTDDEPKDDDGNGSNSHGASRGNWWQGSLYY